MKILIDMGHPAHVHLFKNFIWEMEKRGHEIKVTARDKEITHQLLDAYQISYEVVGKSSPGKFALYKDWIVRSLKLVIIGKKFNADIYIGVLNPASAFAAWINRKLSLTFNDTEHANFAKKITYPLTDHILTPTSYIENIGKKQIRYKGYHALASLHPNYFIPNPSVLTELGLDISENIFLIRFAAFNASHDAKSENFNKRYIPDLIRKLEDKGKIVISSEIKLDPDLQKYQYTLSPDMYHDLLYFSKMYIGEGSTSAIEAAILGTPAINFERIISNGKKYSFADFSSVIAEFQDKYHLIHCYYDEEMMLKKIDEVISIGFDRVKMQAKENKERLLHDTIDVSSFMVWFIENYPESFKQMRENPEIQEQFSQRN